MDTNFETITEQELQDAPRIQEVEEVKIPIVPVPSRALPLSFKHPAFGAPKEAYPYHNSDGHLVGYMARFEDTESHKHYYPLTFCRYGAREAWRAEGLPNPAPLYNLREVINRPDVPVLVVRGERNVEAAKNLFPQFVVTTSPSGDGQINKADWNTLKDRTIIVLAHADEREKQFIASVAYAAYRGGAKTVSAIKAETLACVTWTETGKAQRALAPQGWDVAMAVDDGWSAETLAAEIGDISLLDTLPKPLVWDAKGQVDFRLHNNRVETYIDKDEKSYWLDICGQMEVVALTRTAASDGWGKRFKIVNADGQAVDVDLPAKELAGDGAALRETLLDNGLLVGTNKLQREKLLEYISLAATSDRILDVDRVGWAGAMFVAPDRIIGENPSGETVRYSGKLTSVVCATGGTMEAWQQGIAAKAIGNSRIILGLCVAFSAALLDVLGAESGGVHIIGSSSTGKTTLLHVAGSVWGGGSEGYIRVWRMTDNAAENVAAAHNDALLCLDEIGQANGKVVDEMTYMIANGHPKGRMTKTLGDQRRKLWRTVAMSTGETSIDTKIREQFGNRSAKAGQLVRFVEIAADAGAGKGLFEQLHEAASANEFARDLKSCASANYGHAANAFLTYLVQSEDRCKARLEAFQNQFITKLQLLPDADGQVFRVADKFAVFAAAGELAIEAGILPWNAGTAITTCAKMFNEWIEARGTSQSLEKQQHIALIKHFIQTHGDTRFATVEHDTVGFGKRDCVGMIKTDAKNKKVYHFFKESWEQVVCAGYNPIGVACSLHEAGFLDKGSDRWAKNVRIAGTQGYARYYVVKDTILYDGQDVEPPSKLNARLARLL